MNIPYAAEILNAKDRFEVSFKEQISSLIKEMDEL